jgi:putative peptide zinc metalloprotease protein
MSDSLFSTYWYRVARLKPVLRDTAIISRHVYRGEPWYILQNSLNGRSHRFNAAAYSVIGLMDGQLTVEEIWENVGQQSIENAPTQDEIIQLLGQLHEADLIQSDILPSTVEMVRQLRGAPSGEWKQRISNPFSLRFPLLDPDRFLRKYEFLAAPLFARSMLVIWLLIVLSAIVAAIMHWPEIAGSVSDKIFSPRNLVLLWLIYPIVKIFHELGHAFAVRKWGGEVHEMGIILLALTPIPYVDATASASFSDKKRRITVAAMGMAVELLLASIALFVWLNVETGIISAIAYNVMLIGGVSTVVFNGNPLLRYDGYYILSDLIEIPNLAQRSTRYLGYVVQRYLFGIETVESPVTAPGEKGWFLFYGPLAFCYRMAVLIGLMLLVGSRFFVIGVLIALWGTVTVLILPAVRTLKQFLNSAAAHQRRTRLVGVAAGSALGIVILLFLLPFPLWTSSQGVVWLPEQSTVRAGADCEIVDVLAPAGQAVAQNEPLIKGVDPFLEAEIDVYRARMEELYATYNAQPLHERVMRKMLLDEIELVKGDLQQAEDKAQELVIRSPAQGNFILIDTRNLPGHFVKKGELLGYIIAEHRPTVRAVVTQADIGLVRNQLTGVEVRLAERSATPMQAKVERIVPAADINLPSPALGIACGGIIPVDPSDPEGLQALETFFQLDITLPDDVVDPHIGARVFVRFKHGRMPLAMQWYRSLRQLLLRKFYV